jgi:hypothetical protein
MTNGTLGRTLGELCGDRSRERRPMVGSRSSMVSGFAEDRDCALRFCPIESSTTVVVDIKGVSMMADIVGGGCLGWCPGVVERSSAVVVRGVGGGERRGLEWDGGREGSKLDAIVLNASSALCQACSVSNPASCSATRDYDASTRNPSPRSCVGGARCKSIEHLHAYDTRPDTLPLTPLSSMLQLGCSVTLSLYCYEPPVNYESNLT